MNSIDVVKDTIITMPLPDNVSVLVESDDAPIGPENYYIIVSGIRHRHKLFGTPTTEERIAKIGSDHIVVFAYDYDIESIPGPVVPVDGEEMTLHLADPNFFDKLKTSINDHIRWLFNHSI